MTNISERANNVEASVTLAITAKAKQMKKDGIPVIGFGSGEPDFDTPQNIKDSAIDALNKGLTKYTPASGIIELKQAVCDKLKKDNGLDYETSQVVISCGAKHSIYNIVQAVCNKGDEVLIPAPYWVSYPEMAKLAEAVPVIIDTTAENDFKVTPEQLEKSITDKTKIFILNSPSNPTGAVYSEAEIKALGDVLEKKDIYIVSDEIYEKIIYDEKHISIASLSKNLYEKTIVVNGVAKCYAMPGWRIGYLAGPKEIAGAVSKIQSHSTSNPTSIAQYATIEALSGDQSCIEMMGKEFRKRRDYIVKRLNDMPGVTCFNPEGAFYVFPNISGIKKTNSFDLAEQLLNEAHIAVVPGVAFGNDDYIRISYATSQELIEEGMDRLEKWIGKTSNQ